MRYSRATAFDRTCRALEASQRAIVEQAIAQLVHALDTGRHTEGLGLKKLQYGFWEIRAGLSIRILCTWKSDLVTFVLVGTHDEIQRYLKRH